MVHFETVIRENQIDLIGHLNNSVYLELFEAARWDVLNAKGYDLKKIFEIGQGPVILEVNLKFIKEVRARESIKISTHLVHYNSKVGEMKQQMFKHNGDLAAELKVIFGLFDLKSRKLIDPTPEWLEVLK